MGALHALHVARTARIAPTALILVAPALMTHRRWSHSDPDGVEFFPTDPPPGSHDGRGLLAPWAAKLLGSVRRLPRPLMALLISVCSGIVYLGLSRIESVSRPGPSVRPFFVRS